MTLDALTHRIRRWSSPLLALACFGVLACEPGTQQIEHFDEGTVCISDEEDQTLGISVDFGICLSSSCDDLQEATCSATLDGNTLTVESKAVVSSQTGRNVACTADCGLALAECELPPLAPGTYTVVYGEQSAELVLPAEEEPACIGMP